MTTAREQLQFGPFGWTVGAISAETPRRVPDPEGLRLAGHLVTPGGWWRSPRSWPPCGRHHREEANPAFQVSALRKAEDGARESADSRLDKGLRLSVQRTGRPGRLTGADRRGLFQPSALGVVANDPASGWWSTCPTDRRRVRPTPDRCRGSPAGSILVVCATDTGAEDRMAGWLTKSA
jgi:hypothetical protein